ncbi:hypothetical protein EDD22DRAFT_958976 [Suillus occidentalis]|nr:hypothetical protein EDD22DRAFT_958976 [Suillus occidentalis]
MAGSLNSGLIPSSSLQWQQVPARGSTPRPIPSSLLQLQAPVPQPVSAQMGGSLDPGLIPLPQWQQVPAQFGYPNSGPIPPSLSQLPAHVPQPVSVQIGGSKSGLPPHSRNGSQHWRKLEARTQGESLPHYHSCRRMPHSQCRSNLEARNRALPLTAAVAVIPAQFGDLNSMLIPPCLPQWQASVPHQCLRIMEVSNSRLSPTAALAGVSSSDVSTFLPSFVRHPHSESPIDPFQANITENLCCVRSIRTSHKCDSEEFTVFDPFKPGVLDGLKELACTEMVQRTFENGLFPKVNEIATMAVASLEATISPDDGIYFYRFIVMRLINKPKAHLKQWSTTQDGQRLVSKLKGTVKTIHSDFQKGAPIIVLATHQSLEELLMTHAEMQASQTARIDNLVEDVTALDVAIQRLSEDGHVSTVQAPLGHSSVIVLLDYVLSTKNTQNTFARTQVTGKPVLHMPLLFQQLRVVTSYGNADNQAGTNAVADNFETNEVEVAYYWYLEYITSLVGERRLIFDQMLFGMCQKDHS